MARYTNVTARGVTFVFKHEEDYPDLIHIWARHRKTEEDAIYIFFNGTTARNEEHDCWETKIGSEVLWWFWRNEERKIVMIITCFDE
jgi:hypothetical protein